MGNEMDAVEFATKYGVTLTYVSKGAQRDADGWEHYAYVVTLHRDGLRAASLSPEMGVELPWRQGFGIDDVPNVGMVLPCVASDIHSQEEATDFDDWCSEYGYDNDSRKAYATWEALRDQSRKLYDWCTSEEMYDDLKSITED